MSTETGSPLPIGKVLNTSYLVSIGRFSLYFPLSFAANVPSLIAEFLRPAPAVPLTDTLQDPALAAEVPALSPWIELPLLLVGIVLSFAASAAVTYMIIADLRGTRFTLSEALANGARAVIPLLGVLIVLIPVFLGITLVALAVWALLAYGIAGDPKSPLGALALPVFVVPMIIAMLILSLVVPAIVVERAGVMQSMRRSAELTKGHRWQMFWLFAVCAIAFFGINVVFFGVGFALFGAGILASSTYVLAAHTIFAIEVLFYWAVIAVAYYYLRMATESGGGATALTPT
jgi:hypothetical protein